MLGSELFLTSQVIFRRGGHWVRQLNSNPCDVVMKKILKCSIFSLLVAMINRFVSVRFKIGTYVKDIHMKKSKQTLQEVATLGL